MKKELIEKIVKFRDDRNWKQFHNGKDLAISLSLEVNELLEVFQWSGTDLFCEDKIEMVKEELADVMIYSVLLADRYNLDIEDIILKKLEKNNKKYPVEKAKNKKDKYTDL
jgi:NTP pyrophosphatase (non-canonical NTP hydrolase)